jgi:hypothetical protein
MKYPKQMIDNGGLDHIRAIVGEKFPFRNDENKNVKANARGILKSYFKHRRQMKKFFEEIA